jgi:hypothetical protein
MEKQVNYRVKVMKELIETFQGMADNLRAIAERMQQLPQLIERIDRIEQILAKSHELAIEKPFITPKELASHSAEFGVINYSYFTLRQACNHGRIVGAIKQPHSKQWLIPRDAAELILSEGLPAD